jgi:O-antigen/teichoic acid export membrane protein
MLIGNALTNDWYFQGVDDYKFILIRSNVIRIIAVIVLFITVKTSNDYWYFFMIISVTLFINGCVNSYKIVRHNYKNFHLPRWVDIKLHLKPLAYTFLGTFSVSIYLQMDSLLLGILGNETSLGIYTVISKISKVPLYAISAMGVVMTAKIASFSSSNGKSLSNFYNKSLALMIIVMTPMIIFLMVFAESLIIALSGEQFISGQVPLTILTLTILFVGLSNIFGIQILITRGNEIQFAIATSVGMLFNILLNLILIPKMQLLGTVIALAATEFSVMFVTYLYARKYIDVYVSKSEVQNNTLFILLLLPCLVWIESSISNIYFQLIIGLLATIGLFYLVYIQRNKPSIIKSLLNDEF